MNNILLYFFISISIMISGCVETKKSSDSATSGKDVEITNKEPVIIDPVVIIPPAPVVPIDFPSGGAGGGRPEKGCYDSDKDSVCDEKDICNGYNDLYDSDADGSPDGCDCEPFNADVFPGTVCSESTDCLILTCDINGSAQCITTIAEVNTICGGPLAGGCDLPNRCDGFGECLVEYRPEGAVCRPSRDSECDFAEVCTGTSPLCPPDEIEDVGSSCGGEGSSQFYCTLDDSCSANGTCDGNELPEGFQTMQPCSQNPNDERCDGLFVCGPNGQDICVLNDQVFILECTEQLIDAPNDNPPLVVDGSIPLSDNFFGYHVAMYEDWAAVSNGTGNDSTKVYIYKLNILTNVWELSETINAFDYSNSIQNPHNNFGYSLDMWGDLLVVGVLADDGYNGAMIFRRVNNVWGDNLEFITNGINGSSFGSLGYGSSVSIFTDGSNESMVVGNVSLSGQAIYKNTFDSGWVLAATPEINNDGNNQGSAVRVRGNLLVVSAPLDERGIGVDTGRLIVWYRDEVTGDFSQVYSIWGESDNERLGAGKDEGLEIDFATRTIFAGNGFHEVKIYEDVGFGLLKQTICNVLNIGVGNGCDEDFDSCFGLSLAIRGSDLLFVGDSYANDGYGQFSIYQKDEDGNYDYNQTVTPSTAVSDQNMGFSLSASGNWVIAGAPTGEPPCASGESKVYLYELLINL